MARIELIGGAYAARSVIANAQRCINLFPEKNRRDGPQTMTHYQRPGRRALTTPPVAGPGRLIWAASSGAGYAVIGQIVYSISPTWVLTQIGVLRTPLATPVSAADNGVTAVLGDGSPYGYLITLGTNAFGQIDDSTATFTGTVKWDYLDSYLLWVLPKSNFFGSTLSDEVVFDGTYIAAKTGYPDQLVTLLVNRHEIILFGAYKSEIWYDAGNPLFPFAILPGAYIEQGCLAPFSVASHDTNVYWLGQSRSGVGLIFRQRGYETRAISNYAISYAVGQMRRAGADLTDAVGYTYTRDGHVQYVLTFISGDQTWVFDESIGEPELAWHQEGWTDGNGILHRERGLTGAFVNGKNVTIDWQNGSIYEIDPDYYADDVGGVAMPISFTRTFPQLFAMTGPNGQPASADGKAIRINKFIADIDCGNGPIGLDGRPPSVGLRWSADRGRTFGQTVLQSTGKTGEYSTSPLWHPLGLMRYPVLELNYSFAGPAALNGGWVEGDVAHQ